MEPHDLLQAFHQGISIVTSRIITAITTADTANIATAAIAVNNIPQRLHPRHGNQQQHHLLR